MTDEMGLEELWDAGNGILLFEKMIGDHCACFAETGVCFFVSLHQLCNNSYSSEQTEREQNKDDNHHSYW